jgi:hypothetical protein
MSSGVTLALVVHLVEFVLHPDVLAFLKSTSRSSTSKGHNLEHKCTGSRVVVFTVAPHVADALTFILAQAQLHPVVEWIVPVFPVPPKSSHTNAGSVMCIQGGIDPTRRNYAATFAQFQDLSQRESDLHLWLVGSLKPDVQLHIPDALAQVVKLYSNLDYRVRQIQQGNCRAALPH